MVVDGPEVLYGGNVYQIALAFLPAHVLLKQQTEIIVTLIPLTGKYFSKTVRRIGAFLWSALP